LAFELFQPLMPFQSPMFSLRHFTFSAQLFAFDYRRFTFASPDGISRRRQSDCLSRFHIIFTFSDTADIR
jgi:hypothetical protein